MSGQVKVFEVQREPCLPYSDRPLSASQPVAAGNLQYKPAEIFSGLGI